VEDDRGNDEEDRLRNAMEDEKSRYYKIQIVTIIVLAASYERFVYLQIQGDIYSSSCSEDRNRTFTTSSGKIQSSNAERL
jgi:hypothetical protein